jgi:regulator of cell morphogenesis and NO signaling
MTEERKVAGHIDPSKSVVDLVLERPARTQVFEDHGIDYWCRGRATLAMACAVRGIETGDVMAALAAVESQSGDTDTVDWRKEPCSRQIEHIVAAHHSFLRRELPSLVDLAQKLAGRHGPRHTRLYELVGAIQALKAELDSHLEKEEQVLFPHIHMLEGGRDTPFPSIGVPISCMEHEHEGAARALESIADLAGGFRVPPDGDDDWRSLCQGLRALQRDLHQHIHKENNILFPRVTQLEHSVRSGAALRGAS